MQHEAIKPGADKGRQNSIAASEQILTVNEVSVQLKISEEQVRSLIRQGRLAAINVGSGKKRPLYRIPQEALSSFIRPKVQTNPSKKSNKGRLPAVPDFFPGLR